MAELCPLLSRRRVLVPMVLGALLFRALIPAGFMPMAAADGRLMIMFCPGVSGATLVATPGPDPHEHHHHHEAAPESPEGKPSQSHAGHHSGGTVGEHATCVFAASATVAPAPAACAATVAAIAEPREQPCSDLIAGTVPSITRAQSARAPPFRS